MLRIALLSAGFCREEVSHTMEGNKEQFLFLRRRAAQLYLEGLEGNARRLLKRVDEEQERMIRGWISAQAAQPPARGGLLQAER